VAIVSEHYQSADRVITNMRDGQPSTTVKYPPAVQKTQTGYRSGPLSQVERRAFARIPSNVANERKLISALEAEQMTYEPRPDRAFMVHDRDYTLTESECGVFDMAATFHNGRTIYRESMRGSIGLVGTYSFPMRPTPQQISGYAGALMRQSAPAKPEVNLMRVIGELRDAHHLFRAANYRPRNVREVAGSYLNYVFGVKPTQSDFRRVADVVLHLDPYIGRYVRSEKVRLRRSRTRELFRDSKSGTLVAKKFGSASPSYADFPLTSGVNLRVSNTIFFSEYSFGDVWNPDFSWSLTAVRSVRSFATFEYFIPEPDGLEGRLRRYRQLATAAVGGGLDAPTAYDLTPWTWVVDWFVDVGGLLHYQQQVADNQMITTLSGSSYYEEVKAIASFHGIRYAPGTNVGAWPSEATRQPAAVSTFHQVFHQRRSGSPYAISPTWDLSTQQWAIAAAMGIARSKGVPIIG